VQPRRGGLNNIFGTRNVLDAAPTATSSA
jgi:hypothetical protein